MKINLIILLLLIQFKSSAQWSGAVLDTLTHNNIRDEMKYHSLEIDSAGYLHIVYMRLDSILPGFGYNILYKKRDLNGVWSSEDTLCKRAFNPSITASNISGEAYIVYESKVGLYRQIFLCSNHGGIWNFQQLSFDEFDNIYPNVTLDKSGYVHVIWESFNSSGCKINYSTNLSGFWSRQTLFDADVSHNYFYSSVPQIVADQTGRVHIAFPGTDSTFQRIRYVSNRFAGDTAWNYITIITPNDSDDISLAMKMSTDSVIYLLISNLDNWNGAGYSVAKSYYCWKDVSDTIFSQPMAVGAPFNAEAGDIFIDDTDLVHFILNEKMSGQYTGNVIYANQNNLNGNVFPPPILGPYASLIVDHYGNACMVLTLGTGPSDVEVVIYGYRPIINTIGDPFMVENSNETFADVYPNSFASTLTIELKNEFDNIECKMFNILGKEMISAVVSNSRTVINTENLPAGLYFVNIYNKGRLVLSKKMSRVL